MSTYERVQEMRKNGMANSQIIDTLKNEGVPPKEIMDSLSKSEINNEVNNNMIQSPTNQSPQNPSQTYQAPTSNYPSNPPYQQQSQSMPQSPQNDYVNMTPGPNTPQQGFQEGYQENYSDNGYQLSQGQQYDYPEQNYSEQGYDQGYGSQEAYPEQSEGYNDGYSNGGEELYSEYDSGGGTDIETVTDIAEQIVEERLQKIIKKIAEVTLFKEEAIMKINKLDERLTKIEDNMEHLQMSILGRIGEFGKDIKNISDEMHKNQDTFSKFLDPMSKNIHSLKKISNEEEEEQ